MNIKHKYTKYPILAYLRSDEQYQYTKDLISVGKFGGEELEEECPVVIKVELGEDDPGLLAPNVLSSPLPPRSISSLIELLFVRPSFFAAAVVVEELPQYHHELRDDVTAGVAESVALLLLTTWFWDAEEVVADALNVPVLLPLVALPADDVKEGKGFS